MLKRIHIQNFRSILDTTLNMSYDEGKAPNGWVEGEVLPFVESTGSVMDRLVPVLAIYGANASGKTNVVRALKCLQGVIRKGIEGLYVPNRLNPMFRTMCFEIEFAKNFRRFAYRIEYDAKTIISECLREFHDNDWHVVFEVGAKFFADPIATDAYPVEKLRDYYRVECTRTDGRQDRSWLNCLGRKYETLSESVAIAYDALLNDISVYPSNEIDFIKSTERLAMSMDVDMQTVESRVSDFLRKFDLSIEGISIDTRELSEEELAELFENGAPYKGRLNRRAGKFYLESIDFTHKDIHGQLVPMSYGTEESEGTRLLAGIIATCLVALDRGGVVVFDELDRSLHPLVLIELVKMFKLKKFNPHGAQLIFTAHDPTLMEDVLMRLGEIGIVNCNLHTGTMLRRLIDLKKDGMDIRNVHNFRKMYLDGLFSGVPFPIL